MKSDIILIDNRGSGFKDALKETQKVAEYRGLGQKEYLRLQLITEEMLSMVRSVTGEMKAEFCIEAEGKKFDLLLAAKTVLDKEKRRLLIEAATSRKNAAAGSFLGKLRDIFEEAMASDADRTCFDLPVGVQADLAGRDFEDTEWDHYEQSVLNKLADNVHIAIRGGLVTMTVTKTF